MFRDGIPISDEKMQESCKKYHFIINPKSGSSYKSESIFKVKRWVEGRNGSAVFSLTKSLAHTLELVDQARTEQVDGVVVVGGDGTVRSVVAGLAQTEIPLLIIPTGNENLLASEIGLDGSLASSISALASGRVGALDIGRINDEHFMAVAGVGFDAEVVRRLHRTRNGHVDSGDYIWPICRTFWEYLPPRFQVIADGEEVFDGHGQVLVGNISRYGGGLGVLRGADGFDGWLDLVIFPYRHRLGLLSHATNTLLGRAGWEGSVIRRRCKKIGITSDQVDIPVEIDGDPGPSLPLEIEVVPAATKLLLPPERDQSGGPGRFDLVKRWLMR